MNSSRPRGFTLIEVLVALALVAVVLGGTLGVVRESIANQGHLERRLLAEWAASNVLDQYLLEHEQLNPDARKGREQLYGHGFDYTLSVTRLEPPRERSLRADDTTGGATPPLEYAIVVEVREGGRRTTPLARIERLRAARVASS